MPQINTLAPAQLKERLAQGNSALVLLDVRQPWEFELCHIDGSLSLPLGEIRRALELIEQDSEVVVICHHGVRSLQAAITLQNIGYSKVYNLVGGVEAWASEVDPAMARY